MTDQRRQDRWILNLTSGQFLAMLERVFPPPEHVIPLPPDASCPARLLQLAEDVPRVWTEAATTLLPHFRDHLRLVLRCYARGRVGG